MRLMLCLFASAAFAGFLVQGLGYKPLTGGVDYLGLLVGTVSFHLVGLLWLNWFFGDHNLRWGEALGLAKSLRWRAIGFGLLAGVVGTALCFGVAQVVTLVTRSLGGEVKLQETVRLLQTGVPVGWMVYLAIISIVVAPLMEEIIFRGIIYPSLKRTGRRKLALFGTAVLFAAIHGNLNAFIPLTVFAVILALAYDYSGSLLAPILGHSIFNAINFALTLQSRYTPPTAGFLP